MVVVIVLTERLLQSEKKLIKNNTVIISLPVIIGPTNSEGKGGH